MILLPSQSISSDMELSGRQSDLVPSRSREQNTDTLCTQVAGSGDRTQQPVLFAFVLTLSSVISFLPSLQRPQKKQRKQENRQIIKQSQKIRCRMEVKNTVHRRCRTPWRETYFITLERNLFQFTCLNLACLLIL